MTDAKSGDETVQVKRSAEGQQRRVDVVVKNTRVGKIPVIHDPSGGSGVRTPTVAESDALEMFKSYKDSIEAEQYEHGEKIGEVIIPERAEPEFIRCGAAGGDL